MPITATGIGSGLDVESLVSQLVLSDVQPVENRLNSKEATYLAQLTAYGSVKSALAKFQTAAASASAASQYTGKLASTSSSDAVTATAEPSAAVADYAVDVVSLATSQSLASGAFSATTETLGTGTLTISLGTVTYDSVAGSVTGFTQKSGTSAVSVVIDSSNNTLTGVRDALNAAGAGLNASVVNDGSGYRLVIQSNTTGAENAISISVDDTGDSNSTDNAGLSQLAFNESAANILQTGSGADAAIKINGLDVTSPSNTVSGAVEGVSFTLKKITSSAATVAITKDTAKATAGMNGLINGFNQLNAELNSLTAYNAAASRSSVLTGDATLRNLASNVRASLNAAVANSGGQYSTLAELGITTNVIDGSLSLNNTKFAAILENDATDVAKVLAAFGTPSNANVEFVSATTATEVGSYAVVGSLAGGTSGSWTAGAAVTDVTYQGGGGSNAANFDVTVDGAETISISVSGNHDAGGGVLDAASLIGEIQGQLDNLASTSATVTIVSGVITITSGSAGTTSTVTVSNTASDPDNAGLGVDGTGISTAGDAPTTSYTINGAAVTTADGVITGAVGTAVEGLSLKILGSATGDLGTVSFTQGLVSPLEALIEGLLADDGLVDARLDGLQSSITDITNQREILELRAQSLEKRYRNQFNGLETLISQLNTTQSFLTTALSQFVDPLSFRK
jgi:flagellar hook-associated protein 2